MSAKSPVLLGVLAVINLACTAAEPPAGPAVSRIVIDTHRPGNASARKAMVADIVAGCRTDQEKAVAIFNYVTRQVWIPYIYDQPKERAGGRLVSVTDPVKNIVVYGAGGCGIQSVIFSSLLKEAGLQPRQIDPGFAHVSNEVFWDGQWHWLDVWLPLYLHDEKGRIYSYKELQENKDLIDQAVAAGRHSDNYLYNPEPDTRTMKKATTWKPLGSGIAPEGYSEDLALRPGESCTWLWGNVGKWYWPGEKFAFPGFKFPADKNAKAAFPYWEPYRKELDKGPHPWSKTYYRYYGNAIFVSAPPMTIKGLENLAAAMTNISNATGGVAQKDLTRPGTIEIAFDLPYSIADAEVDAGINVAAGGSAAFDYSIDAGKTWKTAHTAGESGRATFSIGKPNSPEYPAETTGGQYAWRLRITFSPGKGVTILKDLNVTNTTMLNFFSRPQLGVGENKVTVTAEGPEALKAAPLEITWTWTEGWETDKPDGKSFTHKADKSGSTATITVGGKKIPRMQSVTIARPAR